MSLDARLWLSGLPTESPCVPALHHHCTTSVDIPNDLDGAAATRFVSGQQCSAYASERQVERTTPAVTRQYCRVAIVCL